MTELLNTFCRGRNIQLLWQPELETIPDRIAEGFVSIEMAEGTKSFVDFRCLDHHNDYSHLPSACVTALKFYGTLGSDSPVRLMVNHTDADCVLTGVTLLGLLPRKLLERLNPEVGVLDTDPLSVDFGDLPYVNAIRLWKVGMMSTKKSGWSWLYGMQLFLDIFNHFTYYEGKTGELEERGRLGGDKPSTSLSGCGYWSPGNWRTRSTGASGPIWSAGIKGGRDSYGGQSAEDRR